MSYEAGLTPSTLDGPKAPGFAELSRDSLIYALGSILGKGIGLVMLPILTRLLSPAAYGRVDVLSTLGSAAISGLLLGMDVAALRLFFDARDVAERRRLLATWCAIAAGLVLPFGLLLMVFSKTLSGILFGAESYAPAVAAVGLMTIFGTFHHIALTVLRAAGRPTAFAAVSAGTLLLNAGLAIWLLLAWDEGVTAVIASLATSLFIAAAFGLWLVRDQIWGVPRWGELRSLLRLGLPLAPAVAAAWGGEFANRAILLISAGAGQVAYLAVALRVASVAGLIVLGFQLAWQPHAFAAGSSPAALAKLGADARRILVGAAAAAVILALIAPEVLATAGGRAYLGALPAVGISLVGAVASAMYLVTSLPSSLARRMGDLGAATTVGVAISVLANWLLAPLWGAAGTATALVISPTVAAAMALYLGSKRLVLPIPWGRVLFGVVLLVSVTLIATLPSSPPPPWTRVLLGVLVVLALVAEGSLVEGLKFAWTKVRA